MNVSIALVVVVIIDMVLSLGKPSDLAYRAYLQAWDAWDKVLNEILETREIDNSICSLEPQADVAYYKGESLRGRIEAAAAYAEDAKSEPRIWRPAFPSAVFSDMIASAREMRTAVLCMSSVIFTSHSGECQKKSWFKCAMAEEDIWIRKKEEVLRQMEATYKEIKCITRHIGEDVTEGVTEDSQDSANPARRSSVCKESSLSRRTTKDLSRRSFREHEHAQKNFVLFCLDRIQKVNRDLHLQMRRNQ
jgi:hypothetical protein